MVWFKRMVFILLFNIGWYTVSSVEITKSVSPPPPFQIEKPPTITWNIKYKDGEHFRWSFLYLNDDENLIATYADGLSKEGKLKLNGKANVTITLTEVCVKFFRLEYMDEFNFTGLAAGGKSFRSIVEKKSKLYISNIKGGPVFCGDSGLKDVYVFLPGTSTFDVTICGHDRPKLWYTFDGKTKEAESTIVDVKVRKYKYKIMIEDLKVEHCGQELVFESVGFGTIEKKSKVIVKYRPPTIKDFEFLRDQHQNCSIINIKIQRNPACPLKYIITIYDAQKNILKGISRNIRNPVTTETDSFKSCLSEWYTNGAYATVQAVWEHQSSQKSIKGEISNFVKVKEFEYIERFQTNINIFILYVIPVASGLVFILIIIFIILCKYKCSSTNSTNTNQNTSNVILKEIPEYEEIKTELMNHQTYEQLDLNAVRYDNYEQLIKEPNKCIYSELGKEGGRKGAKPKKQRPSNYADAKDVDYSIPHMRRL